jgi:enoyl-CoA hydratase/carnithine racemase
VVQAEVSTSTDGHVGLVGFHRPPDNFFDVSLISQLADALEDLAADPTCRAAVIWSEGRNFCAGARLDGGDRDPSRGPSTLYEQGLRLFALRLPMVAAVQGAAVGGGLGLALAADFRVGTARTRFHCNFSRLGFHQGFGISVTLPAVVGQQRALALMYTGGQLRGREALDAGLCDRLVDDDRLLAEALALASEIAGNGPLAVAAIRQTMRAGLVDRVRQAMGRETEAQLALAPTEDFAEGVRAMTERRPPRFVGR